MDGDLKTVRFFADGLLEPARGEVSIALARLEAESRRREAEAAAMREALELAQWGSGHLGKCCPSCSMRLKHAPACGLSAALATDAGRALLEEVKRLRARALDHEDALSARTRSYQQALAGQQKAEAELRRALASIEDEVRTHLQAEAERDALRAQLEDARKTHEAEVLALNMGKDALRAEVERLKGLVPGRPDLLSEAARLRLAMEQAQCELRTPSAARQTLSDALRGGDPASLSVLLAQARREERERVAKAVDDLCESTRSEARRDTLATAAAAIRAMGDA